MENSIITKKTNLSKFVNFVKSRLDNTPVIVNNKDNVRVGNYVCIQDSGQWTVLYKKTLIEKFTLRASAVAWCIATIAERYNDAKVVKKEDLEYGRIVENSYVYLTRFNTTTDMFKKELMWIRYDDSMHQLSIKKNLLTDFLKNLKVG